MGHDAVGAIVLDQDSRTFRKGNSAEDVRICTLDAYSGGLAGSGRTGDIAGDVQCAIDGPRLIREELQRQARVEINCTFGLSAEIDPTAVDAEQRLVRALKRVTIIRIAKLQRIHIQRLIQRDDRLERSIESEIDTSWGGSV